MLRTDFFDYELPPELIADRPPERRDGARMMIVDRRAGTIRHGKFTDFPGLLRPDDLVVLNNVRVARARFFSNDGRIELLRLEAPAPLEWRCMVRPGKRMREGHTVRIGDAEGRVVAIEEDGTRRIVFDREVDDRKHGHLALPHYMNRPDDASDDERYQTVFASPEHTAAVAAPTAGLHFTPEILAALRRAFITLEVGPGTFQPVKAEFVSQHKMHTERYEVSEEAAREIEAAPRRVAVGTTVTRVLEHCARAHGAVKPHRGETSIFLYPPCEFLKTDVLLTNFHLPKSTLFMLVCAFGGAELVREAYAQAVKERYRFYSYGDCMLLL